MKNTYRKIAYSLSAVAILCYLLVPEPTVALVGALLLQTVAYISIAGASPVDGFFLVGISFMLMGFLPADHPLIAGSQSYHNVHGWLLVIGAVLCGVTLPAIVRSISKRL